MNILRSIFAGAALLALPVEAQEHRFEADPVVTGAREWTHQKVLFK
jgi:hypothetical protein